MANNIYMPSNPYQDTKTTTTGGFMSGASGAGATSGFMSGANPGGSTQSTPRTADDYRKQQYNADTKWKDVFSGYDEAAAGLVDFVNGDGYYDEETRATYDTSKYLEEMDNHLANMWQDSDEYRYMKQYRDWFASVGEAVDSKKLFYSSFKDEQDYRLYADPDSVLAELQQEVDYAEQNKAYYDELLAGASAENRGYMGADRLPAGAKRESEAANEAYEAAKAAYDAAVKTATDYKYYSDYAGAENWDELEAQLKQRAEETGDADDAARYAWVQQINEAQRKQEEYANFDFAANDAEIARLEEEKAAAEGKLAEESNTAKFYFGGGPNAEVRAAYGIGGSTVIPAKGGTVEEREAEALGQLNAAKDKVYELAAEIERRKQTAAAAQSYQTYTDLMSPASTDGNYAELVQKGEELRQKVKMDVTVPGDGWSQNELDTYNYYIATDREKADSMARYLNGVYEDEERRQAHEATAEAWGSSVLGHIVGVPLAAVGGLAFGLLSYADRLLSDDLQGGAITRGAEWFNAISEGIREHGNELSGTINVDTGSAQLDYALELFNGKGLGDAEMVLQSVVQSYAAIGAGKLIAAGGKALGAIKTAEAAQSAITATTDVLFFGSAASEGIQTALDRGLSPTQAVVLGTFNGIAEALGEHWSIENLIEPNFSQGVLASIAEQGFIEGTEEVFTTFMNTVADNLVSGGKTEYNQEVLRLMNEEGMSAEDARKQATKATLGSIAFDFVSGFASGAISMGGQAAVNKAAAAIGRNVAERQEGAKWISIGMQQALFDVASQSDKDSAAYKLWSAMDSGNITTNAKNVGRLCTELAAAYKDDLLPTAAAAALKKYIEQARAKAAAQNSEASDIILANGLAAVSSKSAQYLAEHSNLSETARTQQSALIDKLATGIQLTDAELKTLKLGNTAVQKALEELGAPTPVTQTTEGLRKWANDWAASVQALAEQQAAVAREQEEKQKQAAEAAAGLKEQQDQQAADSVERNKQNAEAAKATRVVLPVSGKNTVALSTVKEVEAYFKSKYDAKTSADRTRHFLNEVIPNVIRSGRIQLTDTREKAAEYAGVAAKVLDELGYTVNLEKGTLLRGTWAFPVEKVAEDTAEKKPVIPAKEAQEEEKPAAQAEENKEATEHDGSNKDGAGDAEESRADAESAGEPESQAGERDAKRTRQEQLQTALAERKRVTLGDAVAKELSDYTEADKAAVAFLVEKGFDADSIFITDGRIGAQERDGQLVGGNNGFINTENGKPVIVLNSNAARGVLSIAKHEYVHYLVFKRGGLKTKDYSRTMSSFVNRVGLDTIVEMLTNGYAKQYLADAETWFKESKIEPFIRAEFKGETDEQISTRMAAAVQYYMVEEILGDAYAGMDNYGQTASDFDAIAQQLVEEMEKGEVQYAEDEVDQALVEAVQANQNAVSKANFVDGVAIVDGYHLSIIEDGDLVRWEVKDLETGKTVRGPAYTVEQAKEKMAAHTGKRNAEAGDGATRKSAAWGEELEVESVRELCDTYMQAVQADDKATQKACVKIAASLAGLDTTMELFRGVNNFGATTFDGSRHFVKNTLFMTDSLSLAEGYTELGTKKSIGTPLTDKQAWERMSAVRTAYFSSEEAAKQVLDQFNIPRNIQRKVLKQLSSSFEKVGTNFNAETLAKFVREFGGGISSDVGGIEYAIRTGMTELTYEERDALAGKVSASLKEAVKAAVDAAKSSQQQLAGVYGFYANTSGFLEFDAKNQIWNSIEFEGKTITTDDLCTIAQERGYSGVIIRNVVDPGKNNVHNGASLLTDVGRAQAAVTDVVAFDAAHQVKSSDLVTYADDGSVIPLEQRFDLSQNEMRYSKADATDNEEVGVIRGVAHSVEQAKEQMAKAMAGIRRESKELLDTEPTLDPIDPAFSTRESKVSLGEAFGFGVDRVNGDKNWRRADGSIVTEVTKEDIARSPVGALLRGTVDIALSKDAKIADPRVLDQYAEAIPEWNRLSLDDKVKAVEAILDQQMEMLAAIGTAAVGMNDFADSMQLMGSAIFTAMKANADKQYGTTYDFPSICTKTQAVINNMSSEMVRLQCGLTKEEIERIYAAEFYSGNPVPCPECYVFSRWVGIGGLLENMFKYQNTYAAMTLKEVQAAYDKMEKQVENHLKDLKAQEAAMVGKKENGKKLTLGQAKIKLRAELDKEFSALDEKISKQRNQGEQPSQKDLDRYAELSKSIVDIRALTWLDTVYFLDEKHTKARPADPKAFDSFVMLPEVLFDLNRGEDFAKQYPAAWGYRTSQGAGYGKAITPYAEAVLGEGIHVTTGTAGTIAKKRAGDAFKNAFLTVSVDKNGVAHLSKNAMRKLIAARKKQLTQGFYGGQRLQSTSDARFENATDYLIAAIEMQAMGARAQVYTKVAGAVDTFEILGMCTNQSLMPSGGGVVNGEIKDTPVGGMHPEVAKQNRDRDEHAGTITIGVNDEHIRAMFGQVFRDFIIPYHASGGNAELISQMRKVQDPRAKSVHSTDYSRTQGEKELSDAMLTALGKSEAEIDLIHRTREVRLQLLKGELNKVDTTVVKNNPVLERLYSRVREGGMWYGISCTKDVVEHQIFPNEYWDYNSTWETSGVNTQTYLDYCDSLGFLHKFSGTAPQGGANPSLRQLKGYNAEGKETMLTDLAYKEDGSIEPYFWQTLVDHRMYGADGKYLPQPLVSLAKLAWRDVDQSEFNLTPITEFAKPDRFGEKAGRQYNEPISQRVSAELAAGKTIEEFRQAYIDKYGVDDYSRESKAEDDELDIANDFEDEQDVTLEARNTAMRQAGATRYSVADESYVREDGVYIGPDGKQYQNVDMSAPNYRPRYVPKSDSWASGHTEQWFRQQGFPIYADVDGGMVNKKEKGHGTQITTTVQTYKQLWMKLFAELGPEAARQLPILDVSSGLGLGTRSARERGMNILDAEPFADPIKYGFEKGRGEKKGEVRRKPNYGKYDEVLRDIQAGRIEAPKLIVSNAVLNVVPQNTRDDLVFMMEKLIAPGGSMFINVINKPYDGALKAQPEKQFNEDGKLFGAMLTSEGSGAPKSNSEGRGRETYVWKSNSVQKVFSVPELVGYLQDALGEDYTVTPATSLGMTAVWVTKEGAEHAIPDTVMDRAKSAKQTFPTRASETLSKNYTPVQTAKAVAKSVADLEAVVDAEREALDSGAKPRTEENVKAFKKLVSGLKNIRANLSNTVVGSQLKTRAGSALKRWSGFAGKEVSGNVYFHKQYAEDIVPSYILSEAKATLDTFLKSEQGATALADYRKRTGHDFTYNTMVYNPKTGDLRFDEAPNFDTAREPVPGTMIMVHPEGWCEVKAYYNQGAIWHHKWLWVANGYDGFDVADAWNWSKDYISVIRPVELSEHRFSNTKPGVKNLSKASMANKGIADAAIWDEQLQYFDLPEDYTGEHPLTKQSRTERNRGGSDKDTLAKKKREDADTEEDAVEVDSGDTRYSREDLQYADPFYSYMQRIVETKMPAKMGADQVEKFLLGKGVKAEEIKWSGLSLFTEGKKSVNKDELLQFLKENEVKVEETTLQKELTPAAGAFNQRAKTVRDKVYELTGTAINGDDWISVTSLAWAVRSARLDGPVGEAIANRRLEIEEAFDNTALADLPAWNALGKDNFLEFMGSLSQQDRLVDVIRTNIPGLTAEEEALLTEWERLYNFATDETSISKLTETLAPLAEDIRLLNEERDAADTEAYEVAGRRPRWEKFTEEGHESYREYLYSFPGEKYSAPAAVSHWENTRHGSSGVFAHARVDDMTSNSAPILFIEEVQSDWNNEGNKKSSEGPSGFRTVIPGKQSRGHAQVWDDIRAARARVRNEVAEIAAENGLSLIQEEELVAYICGNDLAPGLDPRVQSLVSERLILLKSELSKLSAERKALDLAPDAPYAGKTGSYLQYVLKNLLRKAAEGGYAYLAWTDFNMQLDRWNPGRLSTYDLTGKGRTDDVAFEEGYYIEYDQDIPKFLKKYGKQWGATVSTIALDSTGQEVWAMEITDPMRDAVLYEGQTRFSNVSAEEDAEYLELAKDPEANKERLQAMTDEAAAAVGYTQRMWHGSSYEFTAFDKNKIRAGETDAPVNGFWFSDDPNTLPAWTRLKKTYGVYLSLKNPASWAEIREVAKQVRADRDAGVNIHDGSRSMQDEVRYRLQELGYDGFIFEQKPEVNTEELDRTGRTIVYTDRYGPTYVLQRDGDGYHDLYQYNDPGEPLTPEEQKRLATAKAELGTVIAELQHLDSQAEGVRARYAAGGMSENEYSAWAEKYFDESSSLYHHKVELESELSDLRERSDPDAILGEYLTGYGPVDEFLDSFDTVMVTFEPEQIKSADPVTYDADGNVIPLSERFKTDRTGEDAWKNQDIRYSKADDTVDIDVAKLMTIPAKKKSAGQQAMEDQNYNLFDDMGSGQLANGVETFKRGKRAKAQKTEAYEQTSLFDDVIRFSRANNPEHYQAGINIDDSQQNYTDDILDTNEATRKKVETRPNRKLDSYRGKEVGLVSTGKGQATMKGWATVRDAEPIIWTDYQKFRDDYDLHHVEAGSRYDMKPGETKYGYYLDSPRTEEPYAVTERGITARDVYKPVQGTRKSAADTEYLELAKNPEANRAELQRLTLEAAKEAGYDTIAYHGTYGFGRTVFDRFDALFLTDKVNVARNFSGGASLRDINTAPINVDTAPIESVVQFLRETVSYCEDLAPATEQDFQTLIDRWAPLSKAKLKMYGLTAAWNENTLKKQDAAKDLLAQYKAGAAFYVAPGWSNFSGDVDRIIPNANMASEEDLRDQARRALAKSSQSNGGVYRLVASLGNTVSVNGGGRYYADLPIPTELSKYATPNERRRGSATTDQLLRMAYEAGYDSVTYKDIVEGGDYGRAGLSTVYAVINPTKRVKSADPVTYDADGNVIPLSERFKTDRTGEDAWKNSDIRYAKVDNEGRVENPYAKGTLEYELLNRVTGSTPEDVELWLQSLLDKANGITREDITRMSAASEPLSTRKGFAIPPRYTQADRDAMTRLLEELRGNYGALKEGENAAREANFPQRVNDETYVRRFWRTATEAKVTPEHMVDELKHTLLSGDDAANYVRISDAQAIRAADQKLADLGWDKSLTEWEQIASPLHRPTKYDVAFGETLYVAAARQGMAQEAERILADLAEMSTTAGQVVQGFSMLKKMGVGGQLHYIERVVDRMNAENEKKILTGKAKRLVITEADRQAILNAETREEMDKLMEALIQRLADDIPVTMMEKWNAWRYLSMLGNARTHGRNIIGNFVFMPVVFLKNALAAAGEAVFVDKAHRTKYVGPISDDVKAYAKEQSVSLKNTLQGGGKYNVASELMDRRHIFKNKFLEGARKFNGAALETEDWWALKPHFERAFAGFIMARGVSVESLRNGQNAKLLHEAQQYAIQEAQKATYRDASALASAISQLKRTQGLGLLIEGVLPFAKTPVNILRRAVDYSPVGIIKGLSKTFEEIKAGKKSAAEGITDYATDLAAGIDMLSSGAIGTIVMMLGFMLAKMGVAKGKGDDDDDDALKGIQDYSLTIGGVNFTIDWVAPMSMPFFVGVALDKLRRQDEEGDLSAWDVMDSLTTLAEPMLSLSMLDGLNSALSSTQYADGNQKLTALLINMISSYAAQGVPTVMGQLARTIDDTRRATYIDKNVETPSWMQSFIQRSVQGKVPWWESHKMAYVDAWGRTDTQESLVLRALENFLSPAYVNMVQTTPMDTELERLVDATGDASLYVSKPTKQIGKVNLTASQYEELCKSTGTLKASMLAELFTDMRYAALNDDEKAVAVNVIYEYVGASCKKQLMPDYKLTTKWILNAMDSSDPYDAVWDRIEARVEELIKKQNESK